jgi:hypothetical protein
VALSPNYMEVTAQILDALAFLLVTPEFLGEQTLSSITYHLEKASGVLISMMGSRILGRLLNWFFILFFIFLVSAFIVFFATMFTKNILPLSNTWNYGWRGLEIIGSPLVIFGISYFIVTSAVRLVVRRIMFSVGVVLFFLARGISVWHALGIGEQ